MKAKAQELFNNHEISSILEDGIYTIYAKVKGDEKYYKSQINISSNINYQSKASFSLAVSIVNNNYPDETQQTGILIKNELADLIIKQINE
jgi:hypothetical protein